MKVITIGRSQESNIVVNDDRVSRIHLQIVQDDNGNCSVVDLNSANGTFVNGQRIRGEYYLQASDIIRIGDTVLPWQSYLNISHDGMSVDEIPELPQKRKYKHTIWVIIASALLLLVCGGIAWKVYYDKKQAKIEMENREKEEKRLLQEENERKMKTAEEKRLQTEADSLMRVALISQREFEKAAKEKEQKAKEAERRAKEEEQKAKEAERKAKEATQKEKDKVDFDQLKIEAEKLRDRGADPASKIAEMKKIAERHPTDPYFLDIIKNLEN